MQSITIYQLYDNGSRVTMSFNAVREGQMFLSRVMNFNISELEQIMHWAEHSEVKVLSDSCDEQKNWFQILSVERKATLGYTH